MKIGFINAFFLPATGYIPIGIISLCTILKKNNISSEIVDFNILNQSEIISNKDFIECNIESFGNYILKREFSIISFYTMANSYHISIALAKYIKLKSKSITIIFAGPQATVCAEDTLRSFPFIDLVARGEGELTICEIINSVLNNNYSLCPNITYKENNKIITNSDYPLIENMDELPLLDYEFVPYVKNFESMPIEVGRGCPFSCKFCSTKNFWQRQYRLKSNDRIISEVKLIIETYNIRKFNFEHDSLTANRERIFSFCNAIIKNKLNISWGCSSRVDVLDEELIILLKESGCNKIFMGIETGSPRMQKVINKNLKLDKTLEVIFLLKKYKIDGIFSFIYGFPDESMDDLSLTLNLILKLLKLKINNIQLHKLCILRGTEFYNRYKENLLEVDWQLDKNFNMGGRVSDFKDLIINYPSLFPQYYKLNNTLEMTDYLEIFVNVFLNIFNIKYIHTSNYILKYFNGNIINMYLDLHNWCGKLEEPYKRLNNNSKFKSDFLTLFDSVLEEYLNCGKLKSDIIAKSLYKFENDYYDWSLNANSRIINSYNVDIYTYLKSEGYNLNIENINYKINLEFYKQNNRYFIKKVD